MRLRVASLPTLVVCAAGLAGLVVPATSPRAAVDAQAELAAELAAALEVAGRDAGRNSETARPAKGKALDRPLDRPLDRQVLSVGRGDTLMEMLTGASVPRDEASEAISALRDVYDPRKLQVGQRVTVLFEPRRGAPDRFVGLEFEPEVARSVSVARRGGTAFESAQVKKEIRRELVAAEAVIKSSLFEAGNAAGVPVSVMMAVIRTYSYEVDFQRDLQPGDRFEVLYERKITEDGQVAGEGEVLYANLILSGDAAPIYRHAVRDGRIDYYNREGESIRRALLRTPVDGAKLTSGFGMRHHPILGYSKMHKGMDFGAPTGTPVYAAGNGVVEQAGGNGAYGNYVRIRHNTEVSTAYAHLSRFAKGMKRGMRVDQGDVIGFVGSTGRSTGPHLHYEVLKAGHQVNPKAIDLPTGEKLAGRELQAFQQTVRSLDRAYTEAKAGMQLARSNQPAGEDKGCSKGTIC